MPQPRRASPGAQRTATAGVQAQRRPQSGGSTIVASAALVAAMNGTSQALLAGGAQIQAAVATELPKQGVLALVRGTRSGLRALSIQRRRGIAPYVDYHYRRRRPGATPEEVRAAVREELDREMMFRRRQLARVQRDLPRALRHPTRARRQRAVSGVVNRERHYSTLREEAVASRAAGAAEALNVRELDPDGALWQLGPRIVHTPDCEILHGHVLPWEVLEAARLIPPIHNGCGCRLRPRREAWLMGITPSLRPVLSVPDAWALVARARAAAHERPHGVHLGAAAIHAG